MQQDIEFDSLGASLCGWLYRPDGPGPFPAIAMAHGFTATRTMALDKYAEEFSAAGFATLVYDHRGFGASAGEPRLQTNHFVQAQGYLDAVTFLCTQNDIASDRIAAWGDSMSASVVLLAASMDKRIRAVIAQIPSCGAEPPPADPDGTGFAVFRDAFLEKDVLEMPVQISGPMPVVSDNPERQSCFLPPRTAWRWFMEYGGKPGSGWKNEATRAMPDLPVPWHVGLCAPHIEAPVQMMIAPEDEIISANPDVSRAVFQLLAGPKALVEISGGHFGLLWHPGDLFDQAVANQIAFLRENL